VIYDPGFVLSVLATFGLIYLTPKVKSWFLWVPEKKFGVEWRELVAATTAVQFFVFPYLLYKMGTVSIIAPVANLAVLPIIPMLMLFGFLTGVLGIFWRPLALPFGLASFVLLSFIIAVADLLARVPFAAVSTATFPLWLTLLLYAVIFFISWRWRNFSQSPPNSN
jgi:competence protein ComEC